MVPVNRPNEDGKPSAEGEEGRPMIKENAHQPHATSTQSETRVSQGLEGVRKAAKENKGTRFTALLHHMSADLLRESFFALKRKAAPGVDGVTWQDYEAGLEDRLIDLHDRIHRGAFRALPSRRVYIPKNDGRQRPLGVAAPEDKIVQQATVTILNQIYEEDFLGFSYGFRPGRSQHDALDALAFAIQRKQARAYRRIRVYFLINLLTRLLPRNGAKKCECLPAPPAITISNRSGLVVTGIMLSGVNCFPSLCSRIAGSQSAGQADSGILACSQKACTNIALVHPAAAII